MNGRTWIGGLLAATGTEITVRVCISAVDSLPNRAADVAEAFVAAVEHPRASRTTFEVVWAHSGRREPWPAMLQGLKPDAELPLCRA
jgi:hypothetical protein